MIKALIASDFRNSLIRNSSIQIFWWLVFFPGFFSGDSFRAVEMASSGRLDNAYTASWAIYVRLFSLGGQAIWIVTLINGLLLVYALTRFAYSFFDSKTASLASLLIISTPLVYGMGLTLWHDIPMTAGLLLIASFFSNSRKNNPRIRKFEFFELFAGSALITFRPNGLPTLVIFALLLFVVYKNRSIVKYSTVSILISVIVTIFGSYIILGMSPINNYYAQEWMRNDLSCYASYPNSAGFVEANIPGIGSTEDWKSSEACTFLNKSNLTINQKQASLRSVPSAWRTLLRENPAFVVEIHLKRHAYLLPIPMFGLAKAPLLHSTIEFENRGIQWASPLIVEKARVPIRLWNALRPFIGWPGFWLLLTFVLIFIESDRRLAVPFIMSLSLVVILFIVAPIPDGRYALFVLLVGQMALLAKLFRCKSTR